MAWTINNGKLYFNTKLHSGTDSTTTITGVGFQPDMTWWKSRNNAVNHALYDAVRGGSKLLRPNQTNAEETNPAVSAFTSDGVTLTGGDSFTNASGFTYASWNWLAGTSFTNDASATGIGDIDSDGSVSATAGFSIAKFTTSGTSVQTVAHGLGSIPDMYIVKGRANGTSWFVYHKDIGNTHYLKLNANEAKTDNTMWGDTSPTSTVFSINPDNFGATTSIGYFFKSINGYSKFGSYTGNGNANGTFIYTGFKPAFVMIKVTSTTSNWGMFDNKRLGFNPKNEFVRANETTTESSDYDGIDFLSNGFKLKTTSTLVNAAQSYIYMAFAENPFTSSAGTPVTAR
jgi:hypothetical protein